MRKTVLRRRARAQRKKQAVSPVVATLILILVAVAAAAALYLWLVAWQGGVTGSIGSPQAHATLQIGGSTSVYPFDQVAVTQFEQNNSNVVISNNQGGTGAGMLAVCHGSVDIGTSSSLQTVSGLETSDQCPSTTVITTVAYDAVDVVTSTLAGSPSTVAAAVAPACPAAAAACGPLVSMNNTVLTAIYADASTTVTGLTTANIVGGAWLVSSGLWTPGAGTINWDAIPSTVVCTGAIGSATCPSVNLAHTIDTVSRSDASGTTQSFEARLLGATSATGEATSIAALGFSGCGSNNLLADCAMTTTKSAEGNPAVITTVAADVDAIGYASDGLVRATGSGVAFVDFNGPAETCASGTSCAHGAVIPSLGATGTIAAGITSSTTVPNYAGWRPFEFVTTNTPTGEAQQFIQYVMDPANNLNFAAESAEVSIYSI